MGRADQPVGFGRRRLGMLDIESRDDADMRLGCAGDRFRGAREIALGPIGHLADVALDLAPDDRLDPGYVLTHYVFPLSVELTARLRCSSARPVRLPAC